MKALLLAGGRGTRLWPLSKKDSPKQILDPLNSKKNLLEMTIERTQNLNFENKNILLITTQDQEKFLAPFWNKYNLGNVVIEPKAQNTGPALLLATKYLMEEGMDFAESIYTFPTDHYIKNFKIDLNISLKSIICCFRVIPTRADIGYGYMQTDNSETIKKILVFKEKPDQKTAEKWYESWVINSKEEDKYFWNSGIYGFTLKSLSSNLKKIDKDLYKFWKNSTFDEFLKNYAQIPSKSFDHMIAENSDNLYSLPLNADFWSDLGSWHSVHEVLSNKPSDNIHIGKGDAIFTENSHSCFISSDKNISVACAGVDDIAVIIKDDNILIINKKNPENMKYLVEKLEKEYKELF